MKARKIVQNELNASLAEQASQLKTDAEELKHLEELVKGGLPYEQAHAEAIKRSSVAAKEHAIETKGAAGSTEVFVTKQKAAQAELKATTTAAKGTSIAMKALSIAGNMIAMWAISEAISLVIKGIDNLVHASEKAIERMDEAKAKISELNTAHENHAKLVKESGDRYIELSNKMDSLTTDELEEFNELNKQFTEAFPELITGFDNQGTAIANIGTNAEDSKKKLQELLEQEEKTANYEIFKNLNDLYAGTKVKLDEAIKSQKEYDNSISKANEKLKNTEGFTEFDDSISITLDYKNNGAQIRNNLMDLLDEFKRTLHEDYDDYSLDQELINTATAIDNGTFDEYTGEQNVWFSLVNWTPEQKSLFKQMLQDDSIEVTSAIKNELANVSGALKDEIGNLTQENEKAQQEAESAWRDYTNNLANAMQSQQTFKDIGDEGLQDIAIAMVRGLDRSLYEEGQNINYDWIRNNILNGLKNLDDDAKFEVKMAYQQLFTLDPNDITPENQLAIENIINELARLLDKDPIQIRLAFGFDENGLQTQYAQTMRKAYAKFGGDQYDDKGFVTGDTELDKFAKDNSIKTKEEVEFWNKCIEESATREEAMQKYLNQNPNETDIPSTFKSLWNSIGTSNDDTSKAAQKAKEEILKLAEAGKLTEKAFEKSSIADTFLKAGYSIEEATKKINKMVDSSKQLSSLKSSISSIQNAYQEKKDNKVASSSTLAGMEDTFGKLSSWEKYKNILGSTSSTLEECRIAQNELATEFVYSNNFLSQLTSKNKEYYTSQLKELGIANAQSIVEDTLKAKKQVLVNETKALEAATSDLSGETSNASEKFLEQANMTDLARAQLVNLIAQQKIFDTQGLDTSTKVEQLNKLALAYFGVANAIQVSNTSAMGADSRYYTDDWIQKQWDNLVKQQTKISIDPVKVSPKDDTKDKSSKSKSSSKDTKQEIDWLSRRLTRMQSIIDLTASKLKNLFKIDEKENNINKQIKQTTKLINQYGHAYDVYMSKANKIAKASGKGKNKVPALSKDIINKIQSGEITKDSYDKLIKKYGQKYADKINSYVDYYDKAQDSLKNKEEQIANKRELKKSKIQLRIDDAQSKIDRADARIENVTSASEKNKILDNEKKYYKELYKQKIEQAELDEDSVEVEKLKAEQKKQERDLSIEQHQNSIDEKQSALDVLEAQKEIVTSASDKNAIIDQELALKREICDEELAIAELNGDQNEQERLKKQLLFEEKKAQLEQIANIKDEFDLKKNALNRDEAKLQQQIAENEAKGVGQSVKDYRKQIILSEERQKTLRSEKQYWEEYLTKQIASGKIIANDTDSAYKEVMDTIASCNEGISDCIVNQINWNKAIKEMDYKNYETLLDLLDMAYKKLENLKSIREAHGKELTNDEILKQIKIDDKIMNFSKSAMEEVKKTLSKAFTNGDYGFKLNTEQIDEFMDYLEYVPEQIPNLMKEFFGEDFDFNRETYSGIFEEIDKYTTANDSWVQALVDAEGLSDEIGQKIINHANEYLEALKKQKDYKDRIFAIEKAQYDLEKAKNNLTKKVWDGQQWVYTADTEAVQSAQETFDNVMFDEFNNSIQDLIEVLEQFIKDFNIYDDNGNMINKPETILKKDVLGEYTIADIDKIFTDKVLDTSKLSGLMSNIQYAMPNYSIPNINLPEIERNTGGIHNHYDNIELVLPNITDASTGADLAKSFVNELKNLPSYAKQYDWNR